MKVFPRRDDLGRHCWCVHFEPSSQHLIKTDPRAFRFTRYLHLEYELSEEIKDWLNENIGTLDTFRYRWYSKERNLEFRHEDDVALFKLTWMGL